MKIRKPSVGNELELINRPLNKQTKHELDKVKHNSHDNHDTVKVGLGREISKLASARTERIAELKALIDAGKYQVDSRKIASALRSALDEEIKFEKLGKVESV